ncbi:hypothetical protein ABT330_32870 [Streptomyces sp. NPDC000658]
MVGTTAQLLIALRDVEDSLRLPPGAFGRVVNAATVPRLPVPPEHL